jgi:membrane-bound serine protease (ClpP class)
MTCDRWRVVRLLLPVLLVLSPLLTMAAPARAAAPKVVVIDIHGAVWPSVATFVTQQLNAAWKSGAAAVVLDMDTVDGSAAAAEQIKAAVIDHARNFPSGIGAFIHDRARGPGSIIPLVCKPVAISPGGSFGASSGLSKADLRAAAEAGGRNPNVAVAFAGADAAMPDLGVSRGDVLTLTALQAQKAGYADLSAVDYPEILAKMGLAGASIEETRLDTWTAIALWVSQPWATILLLTLGLILIIVELMTWHSWGIAAVIGGGLVILIFAAHIAVGMATWVGIVLFLAGLVFLLFETHVFPGHGLSALFGMILIFTGMFLALGGTQSNALFSMAAASITTIAMLVAFFAYLPRSRVWNKLGQPMRQSASAGYVASDDYTGFLGQIGEAISDLRPSGSAEFDGARLPVVSEGAFIPAGARIQIIMVQGNRIVVRSEE